MRWASPASSYYSMTLAGTLLFTATTGNDGSYSVVGLTPNGYTVRETDPSGYVSTTSNIVPVLVPANGVATANFGDQQVGTVSGTVFSDLNGNGVQDPGESGIGGVTVELLDSNGNVVGHHDHGRRRLLRLHGRDRGAYTVRETDPGGYVSTTNNTRARSACHPAARPPPTSATSRSARSPARSSATSTATACKTPVNPASAA